jgi:dephospho-CoA kinase
MLVLGITGGVATGKSTVTQMLADLGAPTISADLLARDLLKPGTELASVVLARFPECRLSGASDAIDRRALGRRVFADAEARRWLEELLHPPIIAALENQVRQWRAQPGVAAAAEIPLLFEVGLESLCDRILVVSCAEEIQIARIAQRLHGSQAEARELIAAQLPLEQKVARAHQVITTDVSLKDTQRQVQAYWAGLVP